MCPLAMNTGNSFDRRPDSLVYKLPIRSKCPEGDASDSDPRAAPEPTAFGHDAAQIDLLSSMAHHKTSLTTDRGQMARPTADSDMDEEDDDSGEAQFSLPNTAPQSLASTPALSTSPELSSDYISVSADSRPTHLAARRGQTTFRAVKFDLAGLPDVGSSASAEQPQEQQLQQPQHATEAALLPEWLQPAMTVVMELVQSQELHGQSMKVLSQALPLPSSHGQHAIGIVQSLRTKVSPSKLTFINLMHALSNRSKMSDLPQTPPTTPGPAIGSNNDYFTARVFDSAVPALDYEDDLVAAKAIGYPLSAPSSLQLSIVERYIPSSSSIEVMGMFDLFGHSLLVDRLVELSAPNGCVLFIYPTKQGGQAFKNEYLSPCLDQTLRKLMSLYDLTEDFARSIDSFQALKQLRSYDDMASGMSQVVTDINANVPHARTRLRGARASYRVVYSGQHELAVEAAAWVEWWTKQEKQRIREAISSYFGRRRKLPRLDPSKAEVQEPMLMEELFEGVKSCARRLRTEQKLEVGVFVVQRV